MHGQTKYAFEVSSLNLLSVTSVDLTHSIKTPVFLGLSQPVLRGQKSKINAERILQRPQSPHLLKESHCTSQQLFSAPLVLFVQPHLDLHRALPRANCRRVLDVQHLAANHQRGIRRSRLFERDLHREINYSLTQQTKCIRIVTFLSATLCKISFFE